MVQGYEKNTKVLFFKESKKHCLEPVNGLRWHGFAGVARFDGIARASRFAVEDY